MSRFLKILCLGKVNNQPASALFYELLRIANLLKVTWVLYPGDNQTVVSCGQHTAKSCADCPQVVGNFLSFGLLYKLFLLWTSIQINQRRSVNLTAGAWQGLVQWRLCLENWSVRARWPGCLCQKSLLDLCQGLLTYHGPMGDTMSSLDCGTGVERWWTWTQSMIIMTNITSATLIFLHYACCRCCRKSHPPNDTSLLTRWNQSGESDPQSTRHHTFTLHRLGQLVHQTHLRLLVSVKIRPVGCTIVRQCTAQGLKYPAPIVPTQCSMLKILTHCVLLTKSKAWNNQVLEWITLFW